jgi:ADP-ribose pyrophosphatase YjhB (NUDIX family)
MGGAAAIALAVVVVGGAAAVVVALRRHVGAGKKWASAGGIVVDGDGRVALVEQRDRKNRWRWTLPKGRIDPGESAETAALREVYEESGLRAEIIRPLALHDGRAHYTYFYEMRLVADDGKHDGETRAVRFVGLVEATRLVRARRDLYVLRRFVELRTRITA